MLRNVAEPDQDVPDDGEPAGTEASLVGFGEFRRSQGPVPVLVAVLVGVAFALCVLAWVFLV